MGTSSGVSESETKPCPYCGGELLAQAMQCRHCRRWMPEVVGRSGQAEAAAAGVHRPPSDPAPVVEPSGFDAESAPGRLPVHVVVLTIASLGLYEFYWIWRGWCALRDETGADISPQWRTAAFLVPLLNMVMFYFLLRDTKELAESKGVPAPYSPVGLTAMLYALRLLGNAALIGGVPFGWIAGLATVLPLLPVQITWNAYWTKMRPGAAIKPSLGGSELAIAVLVGMVVIMLAATFGVPDGAMSPPG